jgi:hypothetical protein
VGLRCPANTNALGTQGGSSFRARRPPAQRRLIPGEPSVLHVEARWIVQAVAREGRVSSHVEIQGAGHSGCPHRPPVRGHGGRAAGSAPWRGTVFRVGPRVGNRPARLPKPVGSTGRSCRIDRGQAPVATCQAAASVRSRAASRNDARTSAPSPEPRSGSIACSGCGMSPITFLSRLTTAATSATEPLGFSPAS